ncbi:ABC transporter permease [Flavihumibacter fluvii]|uniref:ABC transporter permease n=1 Tax=Flavihumibacter fluvii TaxID=2838157 RepID=UPI001BDE8DFC|nr:ABC transporter permease [Flavihumibacter fluvii]ULQ51805.1 ABC transporter permease [Flavihumibacter fluvii]
MLTNYFKIAWRNLFRNKLHTSINIGGLIIGFTIGIVILMVVYSQLRFDNFHKNGNRIYQAYNVFNKKTGEDVGNSFGYPAAPTFKSEVPAIEKATRFLNGGKKLMYNNKELSVSNMMVDEDFLSIFSFPVVKGTSGNPLARLTDIAITEYAAKKIFGNEDPIGKTVNVSTGETMQALTVAAVLKDFPENSSIRFDILTRIENRSDYANNKNRWDNQHHPVYVQLKEGATQAQAEAQLKQVNQKYLPEWYTEMKKNGGIPDQQGDLWATRLLPLNKIHFTPRVNGRSTTSYAQIAAILVVGLLIILIASFNFININLANAFTRSKEIGVRKCLGAAKGRLFGQLWSESFLVCFIAFLVSLLLIKLGSHYFTSLQEMNININEILLQPVFIALSLGLLLFVSLIAGGYPSWLMAKFKVVETLKGKVSLQRKSILRNGLIVAQFSVACIMITCTVVIYRQFQYLQSADLGINKDYMVSIPLYNAETGKETINKLRNRLVNNPQILSITGSNINIGQGLDRSTSRSRIGFDYKEKSITTNMAAVDYDYLKTMGVKTIDGRDFDRAYGGDSLYNVLVSESVAKQFNEKNLVGMDLLIDSTGPRWHVVGIFPDFHLYSLHEAIAPLTLTMYKEDRLSYCFVKLSSRNLISAMETLKNEMAILEPGHEFMGSFVEENINNWYRQEKMMSIMFSIAAIVSIALSCMGLLAMVLLIIQHRVKEIGVRKVLGASVQNISLLISKEFLLLVVIAVLIATPIAWMLMYKWLQDFPYRIDAPWWIFAGVALLAIIIALLTISVNTVRAAMQNPVKSLRTE